MRRAIPMLFCILLLAPLPSQAVLADCPGNRAANAGFEEGRYKGEDVGTSLSSWLSNGWLPWAVLGDQMNNREPEFFVVDAAILQEGSYRVHGGNYAQKFFTGFSTHTAGLYQRVPVIPGSRVTFSIWAQIATGQRDFTSDDLPISDLDQPGNYRVWAGIDPFGDAPAGFGAPPSPNTVWSDPVLDRETRMRNAQGHDIDAWVQLSASAIARSDYVTVYTKGQPEFPVKNNSSFWDDACLIVEAPPTNTPVPTSTPSPTATPTNTSLPTATPTETALPTVAPTETCLPTTTPTDRPQPAATATEVLVPTATEALEPPPAATVAMPKATQQLPAPETATTPGLYLVYVGLGLLLIVGLLALILRLRR